MNIGRIFLAGIIVWIITGLYTWLTCGWLFNWVYNIPPTNIWRDPMALGAGNITLVILLSLLVGIIFALVYAFLYKGLPKEGASKGVIYGFVIWLVGAFSGMVTMPFFMMISPWVVFYWIISGLIIFLINGAIVGAIYKE